MSDIATCVRLHIHNAIRNSTLIRNHQQYPQTQHTHTYSHYLSLPFHNSLTQLHLTHLIFRYLHVLQRLQQLSLVVATHSTTTTTTLTPTTTSSASVHAEGLARGVQRAVAQRLQLRAHRVVLVLLQCSVLKVCA